MPTGSSSNCRRPAPVSVYSTYSAARTRRSQRGRHRRAADRLHRRHDALDVVSAPERAAGGHAGVSRRLRRALRHDRRRCSYSTFHGGTGSDTVTALGVDAAGNATVTGSTTSPTSPSLAHARPTPAASTRSSRDSRPPAPSSSRPTSAPTAPTSVRGWPCRPLADSFIVGTTASALLPRSAHSRPSRVGRSMPSCSPSPPLAAICVRDLLRRGAQRTGPRVALDAAGRLVVAGQTMSPNLPVVRAAQPASGGNRDAFVLQLDPPHSAVTYATYLGGSNNDEGMGVAIDAVGRVFVAGASVLSRVRARRAASDAFVYGLSSGNDACDSDGDGMTDAWETQYGLDPRQRRGPRPRRRRRHQPAGARRTTHIRWASSPATSPKARPGRSSTARGALQPGRVLATVLLRFQRERHPELQQLVALPAHSRATINPEAIPGLEATSFSTVVESDQAVVVDRTMTWDGSGIGSHAETSIEQVSNVWYLAEGATGGAFDLYYLLQNPNAAPASVTSPTCGARGPADEDLRREPAQPAHDQRRQRALRPTNATLLSETDVSAQIVSTTVPILVERAMYMTSGAVCSRRATAARASRRRRRAGFWPKGRRARSSICSSCSPIRTRRRRPSRSRTC